MRISPLMRFWCHLRTLCGISSRFQLLSPSWRQVAHALLTRPPLSSNSINRSLNHPIPVRLECVMHAASVYPEPGSNSFLIVLYHSFRNVTIEFVCSAYFCTICKVCSSFLKKEFSRTLFVCLVVVQFSMSALTFQPRAFALASSGFASIHHLFPFVNTFFQVFSSFFIFLFARFLCAFSLRLLLRLLRKTSSLVPSYPGTH